MEHYQIFKPKAWIPVHLLDDHHLCANPKAIRFLEENPERICCNVCLSANQEAIPFLRKHPQFINWIFLAANPYGIKLIEENWEFISSNVFGKKDDENHEVYKTFHPGLSYQQKRCIEFYFIPVEERSETMFWQLLALNPNAISFLELHKEKISWKLLTLNPNSISLFKKHPDRIHWDFIRQNPNYLLFIETFHPKHFELDFWNKLSRSFIETNLHRVNWAYLSQNPQAFSILEKHPEKISWSHFCLNTNPDILPFLEKNLDKINWCCLSRNPIAISLLQKHLDKIDPFQICRNPKAASILLDHPEILKESYHWLELCKNPNVHQLIPLLEKNLEKLHWLYLLRNVQLEDFLKKHENKIDWFQLVWFSKDCPSHSIWIIENLGLDLQSISKYKINSYLGFRDLSWEDFSIIPEIFEMDKEMLQSRTSQFKEELEAIAYSPDRISEWKSMGYDLETCI